MTPASLVVSCEHATNQVPREFASIFEGAEDVLSSHRAWDQGSLSVARAIGRDLGVNLVVGEVTRLLVDLNRSLHHRQLFSEFSKMLPDESRADLLNRYYVPYRSRIDGLISTLLEESGSVVHVSIHSFTPVLEGRQRNADIGFLYDPSRENEASLIRRWVTTIRESSPTLRVRRNYPYRGIADGLTTHFRRRFEAGRYMGIEIEINQSLVDDLPIEDILACLRPGC